MEPLRILITNVTLASYTGTEVYVLDLARRLLCLGHQPVVYTPEPGPIADKLRMATVPVVDDLAALGTWTPDVVHGHHTLETLVALLHFPSTPALFLCHNATSWLDEAPPLGRVVLYGAVDEYCRDRLELVHGVPRDRIRLLLNFVDLGRFRPRPPLPSQPERAVVFSNYAKVDSHLDVVQEACDRLGIPLDVIGHGAGTATDRPEELLPAYDLVFGKAKCALEAMAVGAAVVLCDFRGLGPMVTAAEFDRLRRLNFGARALGGKLDPDEVVAQVKRYDPEDAAAVTARVRAEAGLDVAADRLIEVYREAIAAGARLTPDPAAEERVLGAFLRPVSIRLRRAEGELDLARGELDQARAELDKARAAAEQEDARFAVERTAYQLELAEARRLAQDRGEAARALERELQAVSATLTFRLRDRLLRAPVVGRLLRLAVRLLRS